MMQVLSGGSSDVLNTAATEYMHFWNTEADSWNATQNARRQIIAGNGRIKHLRVKADIAAGAGAYTFNVNINAAASGLSVVLTNPATQGVDLTNVAVTVAGDVITFACVPSGSPTNTPKVTWCAVYEDTDRFEKCILIGGINNAMGTLLNENSSASGGKNWGTNLAGQINANEVVAVPGTFIDHYVLLSAAPGVGTQYNLRHQINSTSAGVVVVIAGTNTSGNNTATGSTAVRGDAIDYVETPTGTPTARQAFWGVGYLTSNPHEFMLMGQSSDAFVAATEYNRINATGHTWTATEADRRCLVPSCVIHGLIVKLGVAVTAGGITFTVFKNGVATALTTTITSGTTGEDTTNVVYCDDFDELSIEYSTASLTGGTNGAWAVACRKAFYSLPMVGAGI